MWATSNRPASRLGAWIVALGIAVSATGCLAAAAAGAAGAIYATSRGVESLVASQDASSTKSGGAQRELKGKHGDLDVTIQLAQQDSATTKVEVYARKNLAEWDKDFAHQVLEKII